jgi:hypothetical protein
MGRSPADAWVGDVLGRARETRAADAAAAVATAAAEARDAATLDRLWPAWWAELGAALDRVVVAAERAAGRPVFRLMGDGDALWTLALARDRAGWIRLAWNAKPPAGVRVTWRVPGGVERDAWQWVTIDGSALTVGGASDPAAFARAAVEPWVAAVATAALGSV